MRKILHIAIASSLLLVLSGGQWAVIQSAAWAGMIVTNLGSEPLCRAVEHTFDGKHPCCLCRAIHQQKTTEKKSESTAKLRTIRIEYLKSQKRSALTAFDRAGFPFDETGVLLSSHPSPPLTPPPRAVCA